MPVAFNVCGNLSPKKPIDDSEVHQSQAHAHGPPGDYNVDRVRARDDASDGKVVAQRSDCGEKYGKEASGGADDHGSEIAARSEEGWESRGDAPGQPNHGNARDKGQWNEERDGMTSDVI